MRITGILLAAGAGRRFGGGKLLHRLPDGTALGVAAWRNLRRGLTNCLVVLRMGDDALQACFSDEGARIVLCADAELGMGRSLACGVDASRDADGWLVALADMPHVRPETYRAVAREVELGTSIAVPCYRGQRGHPVGFAAVHRDALLALQGDNGARSVLQRCADRIVRLELDDPGILEDVDTPEDASRLSSA